MGWWRFEDGGLTQHAQEHHTLQPTQHAAQHYPYTNLLYNIKEMFAWLCSPSSTESKLFAAVHLNLHKNWSLNCPTLFNLFLFQTPYFCSRNPPSVPVFSPQYHSRSLSITALLFMVPQASTPLPTNTKGVTQLHPQPHYLRTQMKLQSYTLTNRSKKIKTTN